jgi:predicted permease
VDTFPMRQGDNELSYWTTAAPPPMNQRSFALACSVTPEYLKVMGIPLLSGRFIDDRDRLNTAPVVVIDEELARHAFGRTDVAGNHFWIEDMGEVTIVGVVKHVRHWGLALDDQAAIRAQFYYPFAQVPDRLVRRWSELMSISVRTSTPPLSVVDSLRRVIRDQKGDQVLYAVHSMDELAGASIAQQRFLLLLFSIFGGLALLLACIGIYGVLSYLTNRRIPEIGLRMVLGATAGNVIWRVLRHSLILIGAGVVLGGMAAWGAGRVLQHMVVGMQPSHPATFAVMIPVLIAAAVFASFLPARRASRINPVMALRQE